MAKVLGILGVSWLMLGLVVGCQKTDSAQPSPMATAGTGTGGTAPDTTEPTGGADGTEPVRKGERGSSCSSDSDCEDELSCIVTRDCPAGVSCSNKSCQPSNFGLMGTGKRCVVHECATKADCCGDLPLSAPAKCDKRASVCSTPTLTGCTIKACTADLDCKPGKCTPSVCSVGGATCNSTADCAANTCDPTTMKCTVSQTDCSISGCVTNVCPTHYCNCSNPDYLPSSSICTDKECNGICGFACTDERCVIDKRCGSDTECAAATPHCDAGKCVECVTSDDCEMEECVDGHCGPQCKSDTQCKLFEACQGGSCVYVGCRTDRECVLRAGSGTSTQDPRLSKCQVKDGLGTCVFPCEIDAQCAASEICFEGVCKYIGCETDAECKTIAGLHNLPAPTPERPWTTSAECRPEAPAKP